MFIRKRTHNKPLAGMLLLVFLFASAFTQSSGTLSHYIVKALESSLDKSKQAKAAALQFPCQGTEKEEKKAEYKCVALSFQADGVLFAVQPHRLNGLYSAPETSGRTTNPLFLLNKSLRL